MSVKYVNNFNEEINLNKFPYRMILKNLFDYEHDIKESNGKIVGFEKQKVKNKTVSIDVFSSKENSAIKNLNLLTDVFEKDIITGKPGRLYVGEWYLICYINGRNSQRHGDDLLVSCEYKVSFEQTAWFKEEIKQFISTTQQTEESGLDFPSDFAFDFAAGNPGNALWNIEHFAPSHFEITIYGPCINPRVLVNGYPYQIFTELESSDYLILDSRKNTVTKHLKNGTTANLYNSRQFAPSVFEKIPGGQLTFDWSGKFGFDITLYLERSEPKW